MRCNLFCLVLFFGLAFSQSFQEHSLWSSEAKSNDSCSVGIYDVAINLSSRTQLTSCYVTAMNVFNLFSGQWLRDYLTYNDTKLDAGQLRSIVVQPEGPPAAFFININYPRDGGVMHSFIIERNKFGTNNNDEMTYRVWMSWIAKYTLVDWINNSLTPYGGGAILDTNAMSKYFDYLKLVQYYGTTPEDLEAWKMAFGISPIGFARANLPLTQAPVGERPLFLSYGLTARQQYSSNNLFNDCNANIDATIKLAQNCALLGIAQQYCQICINWCEESARRVTHH